MRPHRGGRAPPPPPRTVKELLEGMRGGRGARGRSHGDSGGAPIPSPSAALSWPSPPPAPTVSYGIPGGAYGVGPPPIGGAQAAPPGPSWALPLVDVGDTGGGADPDPNADPNADPNPDPEELSAARAALRCVPPNELLRQDEDGDTLLHVLCARGLRAASRAAAELYGAMGRLELREHRGKTPLLVAAAAAAPAVLRDLIAVGADPNAADHAGRTALHLGAAYGLPAVLQAVMTSGVPVNVEARNFEGQTPLHCAALAHTAALQGGGPQNPTPQTRLRCVQILLSMGADPASQDSKSSLTPLHIAVRGGNLSLAQLLLRHPGGGARLVNMQAHGHTALHMAAALRGGQQEALLRLLLRWGADPALPNLEHQRARALLPRGGHGEQLRLLLKRRRSARRPSPTASVTSARGDPQQ